MKTWNKLQIDRKDLKLFALMGLVTIGVFGCTGSSLVVINGIVSFFYTFIPARLERLKKNT
jgi:hypothetical protein